MDISKSDLMYDHPQSLIALKPEYPPRVMLKRIQEDPMEIPFEQVFDLFDENDVLIINKTQVLPRRIFLEKFDIMFLSSTDGQIWDVLFPAKKFKMGQKFDLPDGVQIILMEKGRPQKISANKVLDEYYFQKYAVYALPPYIQSARGESRPQEEDKLWYTTLWGDQPGSLAAPTASLHFKDKDFQALKKKVNVCEVTLHVGLGTFLPVTAEILSEHKMHSEVVFIPKTTIDSIAQAKENKSKVWALGTTSLRSIEAWSRGHLNPQDDGGFSGETDLFLKPGDPIQVCDGLLTNFHQPGSTLISLVAAFSNLEDVKKTYNMAIDKEFRLFSYGDLSIWTR